MRHAILSTVLRWLAVVLILRVLVTILANYPDYFPPNFASLFLQGREATFHGAYRAAFYVHIFTGPLVLFNGLILLSDSIRRRHGGWHRCRQPPRAVPSPASCARAATATSSIVAGCSAATS